jgi:uncharacterized damage-inducible protein DinB
VQDRFLEHSAELLRELMDRIAVCVDRLSEEQIWWKANAETNSIGNLLLHLRGNISQWVLAGLGGIAYERHRTEEFTASRSAGKCQLVEALRQTVEEARRVIAGLTTDDLLRRRTIQGYDADGVYVVIHVGEHMSYHTGQIIHMTKELLGPKGGIDFFPQHRGE